MKKLDWYNLHGEGWGDLLRPDAYSHPAKVKRALARHIYVHLLECGYIECGDTVVDPFAGIAGFALHAMQNGLHWIGVELEPRFFILGGTGMDCPGFDAAFYRRYNQRGKKWHKLGICPTCGHVLDDYMPFVEFFGAVTRRIPRPSAHHYSGNIEAWEKFNFPGTAVLLQGDSRRLCEVVGEAGIVVSSPPFTGVTATQDPNFLTTGEQRKLNPSKSNLADYGTAIGQLAAMPPGNHAAIIGSPPYAESLGNEQSGIDWSKQADRETSHPHGYDGGGYGEGEGQLAAMREGEHSAIVSSPPYTGGCAHLGGDDKHTEHIQGGELRFVDYGDSTGQLANLPVGDAIVGSPPYQTGGHHNHQMDAWNTNDRGQSGHTGGYADESKGQLGGHGETFWTAAHAIMQQCHAILKPGGVAVWVVKRFVRNKQIVEFSQQWAQLGEACGFETVEWIRAWLVEDRGAQFTLFGGLDKRTVKRQSFFRRLYEKKYPGNSIDWEDVIIQRKL